MSPQAEPARRLVLVRHGRTAWNAENRAQGHTDIDLDDLGRAQAAAAAPHLAALQPSALWSSDLARARSTAEVIAGSIGLKPQLDQRLREYDLGERAGLTVPEFASSFPDEYAAWVEHGGLVPGSGAHASNVPGAESTADVRARMVAVLEEALTATPPGSATIVVAHGAALKVAIAALLGWDDAQAGTLMGMSNCGWTILDRRERGIATRVVAYNRVAPDPDFASPPAVG